MYSRVRRYAAQASGELPALRALYRLQADVIAPRLRAPGRDLLNVFRYGADAPQYGERIWIDPLAVRLCAPRRHGSAVVVGGEWSYDGHYDVENDPVTRDVVARYVHNVSWEETGEIARMERMIARKGPSKGCKNRVDILARCAAFDDLFRRIAREGRIRPRYEVEPWAFRELGGIGLHVGPDGLLIRGQNGRHRFAIARVLGLSCIPVRIGLVHVSALPFLKRLRQPGAQL
jgi:hypothetical protein